MFRRLIVIFRGAITKTLIKTVPGIESLECDTILIKLQLLNFLNVDGCTYITYTYIKFKYKTQAVRSAFSCVVVFCLSTSTGVAS
jgi:hypothetical protein